MSVSLKNNLLKGNNYLQSYGLWQMSEGMQAILLSWYMVFSVGLAPSEVGIFQAIGMFPYVIFVFFGGIVSDRFGARYVFVTTAGLLAILMFAYGLCVYLSVFSYQLFFIYCLSSGLLTAIANPAIDTFIPEATEASPSINGLRVATITGTGKFVGNVFGLAIPYLLAPISFLVNGVMVVLSAGLMRHFQGKRRDARNESIQASFERPEYLKGIMQLAEKRHRIDFLFSSALLGFFVVSTGAVLWPLLIRERFPDQSNLIAVVSLTFWFSSMIFNAVARRYAYRIRRIGLIALTMWFITAASIWSLIYVNTIWHLCLVVSVVGACSVGKALLYGRYIAESPEQSRGMFVSIDQFAFWGFAAVGSLSLGVLVEMNTLETAIQISSSVYAIMLLLIYLRKGVGNIMT